MAGGMQGGYPPPAPAPMRKPGNNGILLWSLVGCGVIALLIVIISGVLLSKGLKNVGAKGMFSVMAAVTPTTESVEKVEDGIEAYQKDHNGSYPATLDALVPKYIADKSAFQSSADEPKPMEYAAPKADAAEDTVVIRVHIGDIPVMNTQVQRMYVCLLKNGQIVSDQHVRTIVSRPGKRVADRKRSY